MFRTSSVHHQERFVQAVFADFGIPKSAALLIVTTGNNDISNLKSP